MGENGFQIDFVNSPSCLLLLLRSDILVEQIVADDRGHVFRLKSITKVLSVGRNPSDADQILLRLYSVRDEAHRSVNRVFIIFKLLVVEPPHHFLYEFRPSSLPPLIPCLGFDAFLDLGEPFIAHGAFGHGDSIGVSLSNVMSRFTLLALRSLRWYWEKIPPYVPSCRTSTKLYVKGPMKRKISLLEIPRSVPTRSNRVALELQGTIE